MVIVGAKGFAKEVLEILFQKKALQNLYFFDNLAPAPPDKLFGEFPVLRNMEAVKDVFLKTGDYTFTLGLGNPSLRYKLNKLFSEAGGIPTSTISPTVEIGSFGNSIGTGCNILSGTIITNHVTIGTCCLINPHCSISHDSVVGDFVEMSPGVRVTGGCTVGSFSVLGTNSSILPQVKLGVNVVVGAGAVVTKDVPDNSLVVGVPAVIKKNLAPLEFVTYVQL